MKKVLEPNKTSQAAWYDPVDVKTIYILLCLTTALDFLAVFIRQLVYWVMSKKGCPTLSCETVPGYNLMDAALWRRGRWWWRLRCVTCMDWNEEYFYRALLRRTILPPGSM